MKNKIIMKHIHVFTLFLMLVCHTSCGQTQTNSPKDNIRQHRSGLSESQLKEAATSKVPMSMVRNVRQGRNGDILIASYIGVYCYDGKSFTNITSTIQWPTFWDVLEDRKGNLWFASQDSGVYLLPSGQTTFQHFTTKDGLASNSALHIYEDRAGNIWFGVNRYDARLNDEVGQGKSFRNFTTKDGFPSNNIRLLLEDKSGKLWFGAQQEDLYVYDPKEKTYTVLKNKDGKAFNNVWSVIEDKKGNIWFGADGLWRYDPSISFKAGGGTFTKVSDRGAYAIIQDKNGNIWTTGEVNRQAWALTVYDAKSLYKKNPAFSEKVLGESSAFLGLLEAKDGSIWFGGMGIMSGVYRYDGKNITDFRSAADLK
jgi:ligand-binding sensor domain-containing protein